MKRILYLSHISWGFIKQRPQFLAEALAEENQVDVFYRKTNRIKKSAQNVSKAEGNLTVKGFRNLPFERLPWLPQSVANVINRRLLLNAVGDISRYDYIWISDPCFYDLLRHDIAVEKFIYDCMDDNIEFPYMYRFPAYRDYYVECERMVQQNFPLVIYSADKLKEKLNERYGKAKSGVVLNNAITSAITTYTTESSIKLPPNTFTYIGTISEWMDYDVILAALNVFDNINFAFFGPGNNRIQHERVKYYGSIAHKDILGIMRQSTGLIMPFKLNDLILSVNPVKLYEYVYSGQPVIATRYCETEKFEPFVQLYSGTNEFIERLRAVLEHNVTVDEDKANRFALANTWEARATEISKLLD